MAEDGSSNALRATLFRSEAIAAASERRYGAVLLARPLSHAFLTALFAAIALSMIAFFAFFSITRKVQVSGVLLPTRGLIRLVATQAGVVVERRATEGLAVKAGDLLFAINSERASAGEGNADTTIAALLRTRRASLSNEQAQAQRQARQRVEGAHRRIAELAADTARVAGQIVLQERRVALVTATLQRFTELGDAHFVSAVQVQDRLADLLDQQQRLGELQRTKASIARERASIDDGMRDLAIQAERELESGRRNVAAVDQELTENEARRHSEVRAPHDGVVTAINAEPGQTVGIDQVVATILPADSDLEAELYVSSRAAGFLRPGMPVLVRYQAYAYQKFGASNGTIREVSHTAMRPQEFALPIANGAGEPLYRVRVRLGRQTVATYGTDQPLRAGSALDASILLEERRLYEWVLEPLYTINGRV